MSQRGSGTYGLNLRAGLNLWSQEIYGDWYRDPWGWPEHKWLQANVDSFDVSEFYNPGDARLKHPPVFHCVDVPKTYLGTRPAVIQDPLSRFLFLSAVGSNMEKLHENVPDFVFGWRSRSRPTRSASSRGSTPKAKSDNDSEWDRYLEHVKAGAGSEFGLQADITSFFASIDPRRLIDYIKPKLGAGPALSIIEHVLEAHGNLARRSGLPQRSFASAALANRYVELLDSTLSIALRDGHVDRVARWMDDIVAFGTKESLYGLYLELQEKSRMIDLELNTAKGRIATADEVVDSIYLEKIREVEIAWDELFSDYDGSMDLGSTNTDPADVEKLLELERISLEGGAGVSKPWLRATLSSLTKSRNFESHLKWRENASNIPHVADSLGRYLRGAAESRYVFQPTEDGNGFLGLGLSLAPGWDDLNEWLVEHLRSEWCKSDWVKAQLALAVPSGHIGSDLQNLLTDWFRGSTNAQLVAVAAQRVAAIAPDLACEIVRDRSDATNDPLLERVFAMSLLQTRRDNDLVDRLLRRSPSNALLLRWATANGWNPAVIPNDFDR